MLCRKKLTEKGLSADDLLAAATAIAWFLFDSKEYSLEAPTSIITERAGIPDAMAMMDILAYGRIGRIGTSENKTFAFVHRRFLEYLSVQKLMTTPEFTLIGDIPTDSRGRDALVLYAQVAKPQEAKQLACYCWNQIFENFENKDKRLRAVHCIRFLADAFRARKECLESFQDELAEFIEKGVMGDGDLLIAKLCLEATGLLPEGRVEPVLRHAISRRNEWLQETAFKACRHMPCLSPDLEKALQTYLWNIPLLAFWNNRRSLKISLNLSVSLSMMLKTVQARIIDITVYVIGFVFFVILSTKIFFISFLECTLIIFILKSLADKRNNKSNISRELQSKTNFKWQTIVNQKVANVGY